jgi:hypothetical protein
VNLDEAMDKAQETLDTASTTATEAAPVEAATTTPAPTVEATTTTPTPQDARARDGQGRFAPKTTDKAAPGTPEVTEAAPAPAVAVLPPTTAAAAPVPEPKFKAPQSWKPLAREKWAALPPEVQEEIARREGEVPRALEEASQAKRFQAQVTEALRPYEMIARAAGQHPVQYAAGLMQTAAALQTGAPQQRAAIVANIIKQFGVDVTELAAALDGQPTQAQPHQQQPVNIEAIVEQKFQALRDGAMQQHHAREVDTFAKDHEYATDPRVRGFMASLIVSQAESGVEITLSDAYDSAMWALPEYRAVQEKRRTDKAAAEANTSAQRAGAAAVSIRSRSAAPVRAQPKGLDAAMNAAADKLGM